MNIEIKLEHLYKDTDVEIKCRPTIRKVLSQKLRTLFIYCILFQKKMIAAGLIINSSMTRNDKMSSNFSSVEGKLTNIFTKISGQYSMKEKLLGLSNQSGEKTQVNIQNIGHQEILKFNVGSAQTYSKVTKSRQYRENSSKKPIELVIRQHLVEN